MAYYGPSRFMPGETAGVPTELMNALMFGSLREHLGSAGGPQRIDDNPVPVLDNESAQPPAPSPAPNRFLRPVVVSEPSATPPVAAPAPATDPMAGPKRLPSGEVDMSAQLDELERMVDASRRSGRVDYSHSYRSPEMETEYFDRTGKRRPAGEKPDEVTRGTGWVPQAAELPVRVPDLRNAAISDSTVQPPVEMTGPIPGPSRNPMAEPDMRETKRLEGESDADYIARVHSDYRQALRDSSPNSKVTRTATGVRVGPPTEPRGAKKRFGAGAQLMLGNMQGDNLAANAGSSLVNFLAGIFAPGLANRMQRGADIQRADREGGQLDAEGRRLDEKQIRDARMTEVQDYPRRKREEEKDKRFQRREQQIKLLAASPGGFDPEHNAEHEKLRLEALADGQILPAIAPKPVRQSSVPHTSTRAVRPGEFSGIPEGTKIRQQWDGERFVDDMQNGGPVVVNEPPEKPVTPDIRGDLTSQISSLEGEIQSMQTQWEGQDKSIKEKDRAVMTEATRRQKAAQAADKMGRTVEAKRSLKEWADLVRAEDQDIVGGVYDNTTSDREYTRGELQRKRDELKALRNQLTGEEKRNRPGAYSGETFTVQQVQQWANARGYSLSKARRMLEKEGARVQ